MRTIHNVRVSKEIRRKLRNNATLHERILWSKLKSSQLSYKFRRQHSMGKYIVDFYCPEKRLVIEIDGSQHFNDKQYDIEKDQYLENLNFTVLRFWNSDINTNIEGVIQKIQSCLN
jgi:very-short-patch-repair endonuclease